MLCYCCCEEKSTTEVTIPNTDKVIQICEKCLEIMQTTDHTPFKKPQGKFEYSISKSPTFRVRIKYYPTKEEWDIIKSNDVECCDCSEAKDIDENSAFLFIDLNEKIVSGIISSFIFNNTNFKFNVDEVLKYGNMGEELLTSMWCGVCCIGE